MPRFYWRLLFQSIDVFPASVFFPVKNFPLLLPPPPPVKSLYPFFVHISQFLPRHAGSLLVVLIHAFCLLQSRCDITRGAIQPHSVFCSHMLFLAGDSDLRLARSRCSPRTLFALCFSLWRNQSGQFRQRKEESKQSNRARMSTRGWGCEQVKEKERKDRNEGACYCRSCCYREQETVSSSRSIAPSSSNGGGSSSSSDAAPAAVVW